VEGVRVSVDVDGDEAMIPRQLVTTERGETMEFEGYSLMTVVR
jgi:hypothetical protein